MRLLRNEFCSYLQRGSGQRKQGRETEIVYPEPRGPRVLLVGELVLWYGMFAPCGLL
jgi:hypothetical protein